MNAALGLSQPVLPLHKSGKVDSFSTINKHAMISFEDYFNLSDEGSPSRPSSPKTTSRSAANMVPLSNSSSEGLTEVSLSSSSTRPKQKAKSALLQSNISSQDGGTEVVLCERESSSVLVTPRRLSLLDADMTPSPIKSMRSFDDLSHATPKRVSFCGLGDCHDYSPIAVCTRSSRYSDVDNDTTQMQHKISEILSIPSCDSPWLGYWQTWGLGCDETTIKNSSSRRADAKEAKKNIQRVLRNRAFDLNAKHQRLASLRKDLSPFTLSTDADIMDSLSTTRSRSFTGQERQRSKSTPRAATPEKAIPFLQRAFQCGLGHDSPLFVRSDKEEMFYDSDPEDFICRHRRNKNSPEAEKENVSRFGRSVSLRRDDQVASLVQEMMNEQLTLILHEDTGSAKQPRPHGVQCWIERGQQLRRTIIAPKFFWKSIQPSRGACLSVNSQVSNCMFSSINLMDISRVLSASNETVDRLQFPFCKPKHAFFIKTLDQSILFEANSAAERDRIVKSLRLVVARLGSLLLTNNDRLADEYFAFIDLGPGEEPYWLATV